MDHPHQDERSDIVRPARPVVTCGRCGCRLWSDVHAQLEGSWYHFAPIAGRDARGCRIDCADAAHDALGAPIAVYA